MPEIPPAKILIVDDEVAQMEALRDSLRDRGYETVGVNTGPEAVAILDKERFDLLLTDLMMPEIDGIALVRAGLQKDSDLVCIMMTGAGTVSTAVEAMKAGALDYILKPFKLSVILPVLSRALAVRRLRLENAALQQQVREHVAELESANRELEAFTYSVSHDLRGPLRGIDGFSQLLEEECASGLDERGRELLGRIRGSTKRMQELIEGLLDLSRLGRHALSRQTIKVTAFVEQVLAELAGERADLKIEIKVETLPDAFADPVLLKQVFINLLSNALKFTRKTKKPRIEVGSVRENGAVVYFVRDNGAGFDMKHAGQLFGVFQRLHDSREYEGTGVGLSLVQRIIVRHGGRIWADAAVNKGATFFFTLPD